jgi:hypothetical protein
MIGSILFSLRYISTIYWSHFMINNPWHLGTITVS